MAESFYLHFFPLDEFCEELFPCIYVNQRTYIKLLYLLQLLCMCKINVLLTWAYLWSQGTRNRWQEEWKILIKLLYCQTYRQTDSHTKKFSFFLSFFFPSKSWTSWKDLQHFWSAKTMISSKNCKQIYENSKTSEDKKRNTCNIAKTRSAAQK